MNTRNTVLSLLAAFVLGCAAAPLIVPSLNAQQQAAGVQLWEGMCVEVRTVDEATSVAMSMGEEGWELVSAAGVAACFKRPRG